MPSLRTAIHSKNFPKPTGAGIVNLKMKDGGQVSPWSLKGMGQSLVNAASNVVTSPAEKRANISLRMPVSEPAPAPAPAPVASQPQTPVQLGGVNTSAIARREAVAGLREGGPVGGKGKGDKVPAMLEPEEFVVSNEMMDDNPSLRGALHEMRAETLAKKGMTPAEADAKAVALRGPVHALDGIEVTERPATNAEWRTLNPADTHGERVNPRFNPNEAGRYGKGTYGLPEGGPPVGEAPAKPTTYARGQNAARSLKQAFRSPVAQGALRFAGAAGAMDEAGDAVNDFNDDNSAGVLDHGLSAVGNVAMTAAGRAGALGAAYTLGHGAGKIYYDHVMSDKQKDTVGSGMNKIAQFFGCGVDDTALRQMSDPNYFKNPQPVAAKPVTVPNELVSPQITDAERAKVAADSAAYNAKNNPQAPSAPANSVNATMQPNGTMSFSGTNVTGTPSYTGDGADALRKGGGGTVSSMPASAFVGTSPSSDANLSALRMDAAKRGDWGAVNASLAAQGQAPVRGTDTGGGGSPRDMIMERLRGAGKLSVAGLKLAQDLTNSDNQLRGHQMAYSSSMTGHDIAREGHQLTAGNNKARLQYDMGKDQRDFGASQQKTSFEQQQKGAESFEKTLAARYPGEDGKGDQKQIALHRQMATNYVNDLVQTLAKSGDHQAAAELAQAGPGALHTNHHAEIDMALRTRGALEKANGWMPTTGGFKDSTHPKAWKPIGYEKRAVGGDHVLFPNGHISVNDMRGTPLYNQTGGTSDFDQLIADAQAAQAKRKGAK